MFSNNFLTRDVQNFLRNANHKHKGDFLFPKKNPDPKVKDDFNIFEIFSFEKDKNIPDLIQNILDRRIAVFTRVCKSKSFNVSAFKAHILYSPFGIKKYFEDRTDQLLKELRYYRFEFDPEVAGNNFREPFFHYHVRPSGEPRIKFDKVENFLTEILYFIYVNHMPLHWQEWIVERILHHKDSFDLKLRKEIEQLYLDVADVSPEGEVYTATSKRPRKPIDNFIAKNQNKPDFISTLNEIIAREKMQATKHKLNMEEGLHIYNEI